MANDFEIQDILNKENYQITDLVSIIRIFRSENGCPWDRKQTHKTLINCILEETYEIVEAIEKDDSAMLCEELGDLLMNIILSTQIANEAGKFTFDNVVNDICVKMITRHPHIFGNTVVDSAGQVLVNWDKIKAESKNQQNVYDILCAIATTLPALTKAQKIISKSQKNNVDIFAPLADVKTNSKSVTDNKDSDLIQEEAQTNELIIGKELWNIVAKSINLKVDAETALRHYCDKFINSTKNDV